MCVVAVGDFTFLAPDSSSPVRVSDRVSKTVEGDRRGVAVWAGPKQRMLGIFLFLALVSIMEDQRRSGAGLTNPVNNSSITYPSHAQLGVNPGLAQGDQYPPGYRFKPRDQELISCYLLCKIRDRPLPRNGIHEVTLYKYSPETLAG
ncbi:uncharacterized protein [Populus alba]|uniref:uncharacterized protein n=1 Tax=Populus alba TaxID=43335 RepID=UPI003CC78DA4